MKTISFEPRVVGPIQILGPAKSALTGQPFRANRISASVAQSASSPFGFVTWSDEGTGEYAVWSLLRDSGDTKATPKLELSCRLLLGKGLDKSFFDVRSPRSGPRRRC